MTKTTSITALGATALLLAGCAGMVPGPQAEATLVPARGFQTRGSVLIAPAGEGVIRVEVLVEGLTPGQHGFHIHEKGDCSAPDGMSAGGHFNPDGQPHGHPHQGAHHAGDMPMLEADGEGRARLVTELRGVAFDGARGVVGRGVIVHVAPDDFKTQPTGNSGARMACGVILRRQ